jgi:toxin ParE1/3/4
VKRLPVVPRAQALADVDEALTWYLAEGAETAAVGFVDALEQAFDRIARHPGTGSPRYAHALNLPGLRYWRLTKFPYLVFYVESQGMVDVWRVLHAERDIPAWMNEPDATLKHKALVGRPPWAASVNPSPTPPAPPTASPPSTRSR